MKILVVEDEYYARKSLVKALQMIDTDIEVVGDCETGRDALNLIRKCTVDLIITDIRMPIMDGLELAKQVYEQYPWIRIMIVSGYADFAYAQQAISYQVKNYLVKPIKEAQLSKAVFEIKKDIYNEQKTFDNRLEQRLINETLRYLSMNDIIRNKELITRILGEDERRLNDQSWVMISIQLQERIQEDELLSDIEHILDPVIPHIKFCCRHDEEIVLLLFGESKELFNQQYTDNFNHWIEKMLVNGKRITAGRSKVHSSLEDLRAAYDECSDAISNRLLSGKFQLFDYQMAQSTEYHLDKSSELIIYENIRSYDYDKAEQEIKKTFRDLRKYQISVFDLQDVVLKMYKIINRVYDERGRFNAEIHESAFYLRSVLSTFYTLDELELNILEAVNRAAKQNQVKAEYEIVKHLLDYIEQNYAYDISLNELAVQRFFMNASYISRLFKNQTGKNFSKYLIEFRIDRAMELLKGTDMKISEVATRVGFNTTSHFGQTFKKLLGETPEQYRRQCSD